MPRSNAVVGEQVFHYTNKSEFDDLLDFMTYVMHYYSSEIKLQSDGKVRYPTGHDFVTGLDYSTFPPGTWLTASQGVLTEDKFHEMTGPIPAWPDDEASS